MRLIHIVLVMLIFSLCGCSRWEHRHTDQRYGMDAQTINPIIVPAGIQNPVQEPLYSVPRLPIRQNGPVSLVPPGCHV